VDNNSAFLDTYAWIMFKLKKYDDALDWIEQALALPDAIGRPDLLNHYGDILFKLGQSDKAVEQWEKSLQNGGEKSLLEIKIKNRKIN
jgi:tetratricopeptide (TPR) repeat protein